MVSLHSPYYNIMLTISIDQIVQKLYRTVFLQAFFGGLGNGSLGSLGVGHGRGQPGHGRDGVLSLVLTFSTQRAGPKY
jgi:hypothetical protein